MGSIRYSLWGEARWGKRAAYAIVEDADRGGSHTKTAFCAYQGCSPFSVVGKAGPVCLPEMAHTVVEG